MPAKKKLTKKVNSKKSSAKKPTKKVAVKPAKKSAHKKAPAIPPTAVSPAPLDIKVMPVLDSTGMVIMRPVDEVAK